MSPSTAPASARTGTRAASHREFLWLIVLWAIVTSYNLFKPYHIDDTAYLGIIRWIGAHPLHPMSGLLNWSGVNEPMYKTNQPPLYFYALALWGRMFGFSEPAMHALHSLAALACIVLFHRLARVLAGPSALWATALVVLGPAFVVEQNLMVDVPLLAAWLAFFNLLICDVRSDTQTRRYLLAGAACGSALLIKYSSLVLFPILCFSLLIERRRAQAWTALIPVAALVAWSLFNYLDYGGVHITTRPAPTDPQAARLLYSAIAWGLALGALTPLGFVAAMQSRPKWARAGWTIYAAIAVAFAALVVAVANGIMPDTRSDKLLRLAFAGNGALICLALATDVLALPRKLWRGDIARDVAPKLYLFLWVLGTSAFCVTFAPFIAARHVLLILPAVTLVLVMRWGASLTYGSKLFGLVLTIVISAGLCLSDWRIAAFNRSEAVELAHSLPRERPIWTIGHWGWQWYAEQNGFREVDVHSSRLRPGDILVVTQDVDHQEPETPLDLRLVRADTEGNAILNLFCTARTARFYSSPPKFGPWSLSRGCVNHVNVFRVEAVGVRPPAAGPGAGIP